MSLIIPQYYHHFNMVAIDPGLNNCGVAIFNIRYVDMAILSIETFTIVPDKITNHTGLDEEFNGGRLVKLCKLRDTLSKVFHSTNPCIVACEAPFYNPRMPIAFAALVEAITYIQMAIVDYNRNIMFHKIPPMSVKQSVKAIGSKGKDPMKLAVSLIPEIMTALVNDLDGMTEHAIDAVAVGYSFLKSARGD